MNKRIILLLLVAISCLAFLAGRFTASAPTYQLSVETGDPLAAGFEEFIRAQQEAIALYRASRFFESEQERAEAYRGLLYALVGSIKAAALQSHDFPRFMRAVDWTSKRGLDNPDNNYYVAMISDQGNYRIIGNRGTTSDLVFQLLVGQPGVRDAGTSTNVSVLYGQDLIVDGMGNFEIIVSRDDPGEGVNWLANGDGAETLLVRYSHSDWNVETDSPLYIEHIGGEGDHAPPLAEQAMADALRNAAVTLYDSTATWLQYAEKSWTLMPRNNISPARLSQGGLVGQYSAFGSWQLDDEEALILSTAPSAASYQGIELGNLWFVSLNYESHTSSLTLDQMQCSADNRCYTVISHRDPQIQNWLDTEGHGRGLIFMRWHGLTGELTENQQPAAKVVPFEELYAHLPDDIGVFSAEQRAQQIRQRRAAVQRRFGG